MMMNHVIGAAARPVVVLIGASLLIAASGPRALAPAIGGLWQVSGKANGEGARSACVAAPVELAQWEHRGGRCTSVVIADRGNKATVHYTCAGGGFGQSEMTLVTPRTLRIATQGISRGQPFNYVLHARRSRGCASR